MTLPATDNFNRANNYMEAGNASWTKIGGAITIGAVTANAISGDGTDPSYNWNADTPDNNQYAQIKLLAVGGDEMGPAVRFAAAVANYYTYFGSSGERRITRWASGEMTQIAAAGAGCSANDIVRLEASGTTLSPKRNGTLDSTIGTQTDSTYSSGRLGIAAIFNWGYDTVGDDWEGGNLALAGQPIMRRWGGIPNMRLEPQQGRSW